MASYPLTLRRRDVWERARAISPRATSELTGSGDLGPVAPPRGADKKSMAGWSGLISLQPIVVAPKRELIYLFGVKTSFVTVHFTTLGTMLRRIIEF